MSSTGDRSALAAILVTMVLWASAFVGIRHLADTFSPGALALGRIAVGAVCLGLVSFGRGWVRPTRGEWVRIALVGLLWFALYNVALNKAEHLVDAGTAVMLLQVSPVLIAVAAAVFLSERFTRPLAVGLVLAFIGCALIARPEPGASSSFTFGALLCLLCAVAYSSSVILQKPLLARLPALQVTTLACAIATIGCLPFAGQLVRDGRAAEPSEIAWLVYLGVFPTAIAFTTYAYALQRMDASRLGVMTYLAPPITIVLSWLLLDELPPTIAYVGGALALVGVWVARRPSRPDPRPA